MIRAGRPIRVWPGKPYPLGATWDGSGTNFSVFSDAAEVVELCLFDTDGDEHRIALPECIGSVWHGYLPDVGPGTRYGFRRAKRPAIRTTSKGPSRRVPSR